MSERPLITFALIAYNQGHYIKKAVEGAFSQTYEPLEILLSDDCSRDNTFRVMQEMAETYQGPHRVILNRNNENCGIGAHINKIMDLSHGQYVIIAAGDDISLSERSEIIYEEFSKSAGRNVAVFSDMVEIDGEGKQTRINYTRPSLGFCDPVEMCRHLFRGITGASNAWDRKIFDVFGPMLPEVVFEDRVIAFRAALLGDIGHVPKPLVLYRRHGENTVEMFHSTDSLASQRRMQCFKEVYRNNLRDLELYATKFNADKEMMTRCRRIMKRRLRKIDAYLFIFSGRPPRMISGMIRLILNGGNPVHGFRQFFSVLSERYFDFRAGSGR